MAKKWTEEDKDKSLKDEILDIRLDNEYYGYCRIHLEFKNCGWLVIKKKVQRIVKKLGLQVHSYGRKYKKYNSYKGTIGKLRKIESIVDLKPTFHIKKSLQTPQILNTM